MNRLTVITDGGRAATAAAPNACKGRCAWCAAALLMVMMLLAPGGLWAQADTVPSTAENVEDFEFALRELETSYAGFETKVNDSTRADYDALVAQLRRQVAAGERPGYDAALFLYAWFDDGHLGVDMGRFAETTKYMPDRRKYHPYEMIDPYMPEPTAKAVSDKTFLMRLPAFDGEAVTEEFVDAAMRGFDESGCENLIIDVRDNGGGDERLWHPLLPLMYDHAGTTKSVEYRISDNNLDFLRLAAEEFPEAQMIIDKYEATREPYILLTDSEDIEIEVAPYSGRKPQRIAFIIDANVGSATEELLLQAKAISDNTLIYGKENTAGCLDFASVRETTALPHSGYTLFIPMTRSCRLPDHGIDRTGIAPDVVIAEDYPSALTDNVDEWTLRVAAGIER